MLTDTDLGIFERPQFASYEPPMARTIQDYFTHEAPEKIYQISMFDRALLELFSTPRGQTYTGMFVFALLVVLLCGILATLAYLLSLTASQDTEKRSEYECGFAPFDSATRHPFEVHFYVVGILFLIFDVEIALLFP